MSNDCLYIENLTVETTIGVHAFEKQIKPKLCINLEIPQDFSKLDDDISKTLDYDALCQHVTELVQNGRFNLIETVGNHIADSINSTFGLKRFCVRVSKPHAIANARNITIQIRRS